VKAMHNLAVLAAGAQSGGPDYRTAATWFQTAAEHGLADSQFNLGVLLENGLGVEKNLAQAYQWYALAAKFGDKESARHSDRVRSEMDAAEIQSAEKAVSAFFAKASDRIANDVFAASEDWKTRQTADSQG